MLSPSLLSFLLSKLKFTTGRGWWLTALIWIVTIAPASAALDLRVLIKQGVGQVNVGSSTNAAIKDSSGRSLGVIQGMNGFAAQVSGGGVAINNWRSGGLWIEPTGDGVVWIGDRWYRGRAYLAPAKQGLTVVNYVDLEQYLYSVLGGEMNGNWPQEALKAQAVVARSYALHKRQNSANAVYDLGDTTKWQVYRGVQDESSGTQMAVNATAGQVLTYNQQIVEAVFHSSSGGCTENVEDVWMQPLPYLRSVKDNYDQGAPVYRWSKSVSQSQLSSIAPGVGRVREVKIERGTPSCNRVVTMRLTGDKGSTTISGEKLQSALGLKSTFFSIAPQANQVASKSNNPPEPSFIVIGYGFGHGLGMSQWGAYSMAQQGLNYQQIMGHYYTGVTLAKIEVK